MNETRSYDFVCLCLIIEFQCDRTEIVWSELTQTFCSDKALFTINILYNMR